MSKTSLFRAYCNWPYETAVFVEASNRHSAAHKIAFLIGTLYGCSPDDVSFYNLDSYNELINEKGVGDDLDFRLFESGWDADGFVSWVGSPLFLAPLNQRSYLPRGAVCSYTSRSCASMISARFVPACEWLTSSLAGTTGQGAPAGAHVAWGWPWTGHPRSLACGTGPRTQIAPTGVLRPLIMFIGR